MAKTNSNLYKVTLDRDDVDNAILDYIHKAFPDTDGLDIESWKFRDGGVKVEFNPNTPGVGVSASEYNELVYEKEQLLNEIEDLQDRNDSLEEELNDLTHDYTEALADCEALEDLEAKLNDELEKAQDEIESLLKDNARLAENLHALQASKPTPVSKGYVTPSRPHKPCGNVSPCGNFRCE